MRAQDVLAHLLKNVGKYPVFLENYVVPPLLQPKSELEKKENDNIKENEDTSHAESIKNLAPFQDTPEISSPRICLWEYMKKEEVETFLKIKRKRDIRKAIELKINQEFPKGSARIILIELMYSVQKFCVSSNFNLEQTGAALSIFYLTHCYFTSSLEVSAEKAYTHFKEYIMKHSLLIPPKHTKVFSYHESRNLLEHFCTLYLRNLPLIRLLTLPNYGLYLDCYIEPEIILKKEVKKEKDKKGKKEKGKKGKKKK